MMKVKVVSGGWLPKLLLAGGGCFIALLVGEFVSQAVSPVSTVAYRTDPDIGYVLAPDQHTRLASRDFDVEIRTNSQGFHDVAHTYTKARDTYRVVVLGDSFIEALQVPIERGFTQQLQSQIQEWAGNRRIEIINLGISGTGPAQYYRVLETKGLQYHPDLVLMAVLPDNDFRDSYQPLGGSAFKPYYRIMEDGSLILIPPQFSNLVSGTRLLLQRSALLQIVRKAVARMPIEELFTRIGLLTANEGRALPEFPTTVPRDWLVYMNELPRAWEEAYQMTFRMITETARLAERNQSKFLVMTIGSPAAIEDRWQEALAPFPDAHNFRWDFDRPFRALTEWGSTEKFDVLDLRGAFRRDFAAFKQSHSWIHDGHWNVRGHRLAANVVGAFLNEHREAYGID